jgi:hypothetical protein
VSEDAATLPLTNRAFMILQGQVKNVDLITPLQQELPWTRLKLLSKVRDLRGSNGR